MARAGIAAKSVQQEAAAAVHAAKPWLIWLGRFGYVAKGVVYTLIGVLALQAAIGAGGKTMGTKGALAQIGEAPFGHFLLIAIGIGLVGYALWRFVQAFMDTEKKGADAKGLFVRVSYGLIGSIHVGFAISAFALVSGSGGGEGDSTQGWTAQLMAQPFGRWLVAIAGGIIFGRGAFHMYRALSLKFLEKLTLSEMSATERRWAARLGRIGYAARGIVFAIIGVFMTVAAVHEDPHEARGFDGALDTLAAQPWGWAVLGAVALGLLSYGLYMFVEARYRRMVIT